MLAPPPTLQPAFSGHQTFVFRYTWLKKGVDALSDNAHVFRAEDAIVTLGVGKNMVDSIRHWGLACRVFEERDLAEGGRTKGIALSRFGELIFKDGSGVEALDPFLEDDATLWLLHWNLATNPARATTWYWAFNLLREPEFTRGAFFENLKKFVQGRGWSRVSDNSLGK